MKKFRALAIKVEWACDNPKEQHLPEDIHLDTDLYNNEIQHYLERQYGFPVKDLHIEEDDKIESILQKLDAAEKDSLYRRLWKDYVREDVSGFLDEEIEARELEIADEDKELIVGKVTNLYVYEGEYDCNLSYWDNIRNLIDPELERYDAA